MKMKWDNEFKSFVLNTFPIEVSVQKLSINQSLSFLESITSKMDGTNPDLVYLVLFDNILYNSHQKVSSFNF